MKNRKWIIIFGVLIICIVGSYNLYQKFGTTYGTWDINWGFEVPKPSQEVIVFENYGGFPMNGEAYIVVDYNAKHINKIKSQMYWKRISYEE
jgi:hypothetical protein